MRGRRSTPKTTQLVDRVKRREAELTDEFVERHAIAGPSEYVVERLSSYWSWGWIT